MTLHHPTMRRSLAPFLLASTLALTTSVVGCGGIPKLEPQDVTKVMVDAHGGKFCPWGEVKLDLAVVLKDGKMRATNGLDDSVRLDARKNFSYKASAGKIDVRTEGVFFIPPQDYAYLLENDVVAEASLLERPDLPAAKIVFAPDFGCTESVALGGYQGGSGEGGGGSYANGLSGGYGGHGGDGEHGGDAGPLEVTLGMVDTPKRGRLVIARTVALATRETDVRIFAPGPNRLHVDNSGGRGGSGGPGGSGGNGGSDRCSVGDGGDGGDGGEGADGGNGGPITVFIDAAHPELAQVIATTNGGGAGGMPGAGGYGGNGGYTRQTAPNGIVICERTGRGGRDGRPGRYHGRNGMPGSRPVVTMVQSPFPQGVASVGVRATSSNTDLSAQAPRVKPAGVTASGGGTAHVAVGPSGVTVSGTGSANVSGSFGLPKVDAPSAAAVFSVLRGPNVLRIDNKTGTPICELYPLDQTKKTPVSQSALTSPLAPGQSREVTRWAPPSAQVAQNQVRFGIRSCDGTMEAVAMVPMTESTTIMVYPSVPSVFPPHSVIAILSKLGGL